VLRASNFNKVGNKISPKSFRIGVLYPWHSRWFAKKENDFAQKLREDVEIRKFLRKELKGASLARLDVERAGNAITVFIHSGKPGLIIGRGGAGAEELKKKLQTKIFGKKPINLSINIMEVSKPNLAAQIVADEAATEIEKRLPTRRVMNKTLEKIERSGALGCKMKVAGRLDGAEIARRESLLWGKVPLHNLRADIDYAQSEAHTIYGIVGIKIWIYKGEIFNK